MTTTPAIGFQRSSGSARSKWRCISVPTTVLLCFATKKTLRQTGLKLYESGQDYYCFGCPEWATSGATGRLGK
eukprot:6204534-Pleurochrysis_carterae.AAC.4